MLRREGLRSLGVGTKTNGAFFFLGLPMKLAPGPHKSDRCPR